MGFDHMALVRQNTPYITREGRGEFGRLHLDFLLMIAEKIPASLTTPEWFMPMAEIKHALRMKPKTRDADVIRIYKPLMAMDFLTVENGRGRMANTYGLTGKIMNGASPPPERKAANGSGAAGGKFKCQCEGKDHTNDAACRQYRSYQKKASKSTKSRRGKGKAKKSADTNAPCKYGPTHQYTEARKPLTDVQIDGGVTSILWCARDRRCKARMATDEGVKGARYADK